LFNPFLGYGSSALSRLLEFSRRPSPAQSPHAQQAVGRRQCRRSRRRT
jgi:hypothetical protein